MATHRHPECETGFAYRRAHGGRNRKDQRGDDADETDGLQASPGNQTNGADDHLPGRDGTSNSNDYGFGASANVETHHANTPLGRVMTTIKSESSLAVNQLQGKDCLWRATCDLQRRPITTCACFGQLLRDVRSYSANVPVLQAILGSNKHRAPRFSYYCGRVCRAPHGAAWAKEESIVGHNLFTSMDVREIDTRPAHRQFNEISIVTFKYQ
jgi:hypothetical protein